MPEFHNVDKDLMQREHKRRIQRQNPDTPRLPMLFLKEGHTTVRVLPPWSDKGAWYLETKEHAATIDGFYNPVLCPNAMNDDPCPFCEEGSKLYKIGTADSVKAAKELRPRSSFYANVVVFDSPDPEMNAKKGVVVLKMGATVLDQLLDHDQDEAGGWGDIVNLEKGYDMRIHRRGKTRNNTNYTVKGVPGEYDVQEKYKEAGAETPLTPHNLDTLVDLKPYEELKEIFDSQAASFEKVFEGGTPETPTTDDTPEAPVEAATPTPAPPPPSK